MRTASVNYLRAPVPLIEIDPNASSRLWPGYLTARLPAGLEHLCPGAMVRVTQVGAGDEADYLGTATVVGISGAFIGLDVDWSSFHTATPLAWIGEHGPRPGCLRQRVVTGLAGAAALTVVYGGVASFHARPADPPAPRVAPHLAPV